MDKHEQVKIFKEVALPEMEKQIAEIGAEAKEYKMLADKLNSRQLKDMPSVKNAEADFDRNWISFSGYLEEKLLAAGVSKEVSLEQRLIINKGEDGIDPEYAAVHTAFHSALCERLTQKKNYHNAQRSLKTYLELKFANIGWQSPSNQRQVLDEHPNAAKIIKTMTNAINRVLPHIECLTETLELMTAAMQERDITGVVQYEHRVAREIFDLEDARVAFGKAVHTNLVAHDEMFAYWGWVINVDGNEHLRALQNKIVAEQLRFEQTSYDFYNVYNELMVELKEVVPSLNLPKNNPFSILGVEWRPFFAPLPWETGDAE